jgi:hypothetical protein
MHVKVDEAGKEDVATQDGCRLRDRETIRAIDSGDAFAFDQHDGVLDDASGRRGAPSEDGSDAHACVTCTVLPVRAAS